jgi:glutamate carboxypeptidase
MLEALRSHLEALLPEALNHLESMVRINSWTLNKAGVDRVGQRTADLFAPLGFRPERVPSVRADYGDHLVLTRPGRTDATVAMVSHLDTVFSPEEEERNGFTWLPEGDRIYGPGTHDIKGGTILLWMTLVGLARHAPDAFENVTWRLCFNSSEEVLSADFGEVVGRRLGPRPLAALVFEAEGRAGETRRLVVARKGRGTWRFTVRGRGAHAGVAPGRGANAIVQLALTLQKVHAIADPARDLTVNVGIVRGGSGLNRVPEEAVAEGEFRAFDTEAWADAHARLASLAGPGEVRSIADGFPAQVQFELMARSDPWPRNPGSEALLGLWQEAGSAAGIDIESESRGGLSDGNQLWKLCPTLDGLGPSGDNDHCSERSADGSKLPEYVLPGSFVPKALVNVLALRQLASAANVHARG